MRDSQSRLDRVQHTNIRPRGMKPGLVDEQDLISRAARGDKEAFSCLVREYEKTAFRVAFLITHDENDAADTAQEAFIKGYRALRSFRKGMPFRPWILKIVTNLALNRIQATKRQVRANELFNQDILQDQDEGLPEEKAAERERNNRLLEAVGSLPPHELTLIALRYFLDLPEGEVAIALDVPQGTIKSRMHRTIVRLRRIIMTEYPDLADLAKLDL